MKELETNRLLLRQLKKEDAPRIFSCWANDPEVTKYLTWQPHRDISDTEAILDIWLREYEQPDCYRYGIELKEEKELIGQIDVVGYHHGNPVIGYCSGRKYWGCGYMTEAFQALIRQLFEDGFDTIVIEAAAENIGSNRVIQKNGFQLVSCEDRKISDANPKILPVNSYRLYK